MDMKVWQGFRKGKIKKIRNLGNVLEIEQNIIIFNSKIGKRGQIILPSFLLNFITNFLSDIQVKVFFSPHLLFIFNRFIIVATKMQYTMYQYTM